MLEPRPVRTHLILLSVVMMAPVIALFASNVAGNTRQPMAALAAPDAAVAVPAAGAATAGDVGAGRGDSPPRAAATPVDAPADAHMQDAADVSSAPANAAPRDASAPVEQAQATEPAPTEAPANTPAPPPTPRPRKPSLFTNSQIVVFYGSPISAQLGVLGRFSPGELVTWLKGETGIYDKLNGDRGAVPALDMVYAQAQADPTSNGLYLRYLDDATVRRYIALAEENDLQLILDLQIGRGDILTEVQKIQGYLENPRVHVAIDPEYAVGPDGVPIATPGTMTGQQINDVQDYLDHLSEYLSLPPKLLVIHQYMDQTIIDGGATRHFDGVDVVLNMDAFGDALGKEEKYRRYASMPYAEHSSFNVFLLHDEPVASEEDVMRLQPQPDMVEYQ